MKKLLPVFFAAVLLMGRADLFAGGPPATACACDPKADSLELVKFYQSLGGAGWTNKTNWLKQGKAIGTWFGVTTGADGCVRSLKMNYNGLNGQLPDLAMPELRTLALTSYAFVTTPAKFITGPVPNFSGMPNLRLLDLSGNRLSGDLPNFSGLPLLDTLDLSENKFPGPLPGFDKMPLVKFIDLKWGQVGGPFPDLTGLSSLKKLNLNGNKVTGDIADVLQKLPDSISWIDLTTNEVAGPFPSAAAQLPALEYLALNANQISGPLPDFTGLLALKSLYLAGNLLDGPVPDLQNHPALTTLDLSSNRLEGPFPDLSGLPELQSLSLGSNKLTGPIPDFAHLPKLKSLYLGKTRPAQPLPDFSNLPLLETLKLEGCQLTGPVPIFSKLPTLKSLTLSNNQLTGAVPDFLNHPAIAKIYLSKNQLSGAVPPLKGLPQLSWVDLSYNQLTSLPQELPHPSMIVVLDVRGNLLSGHIPAPIFYTDSGILWAYDNYYTFAPIIECLAQPSWGDLWYKNQKLFFSDTTILATAGQPFTIDLGIDPSLTTSQYLWSKDSTAINPPPGNSPNSNKLVFTSPKASDAGRYTCRVINPQAPDLWLFSNTISFKVCDEQSDSLQLVALFNQTDGANWLQKTNWLSPGQPIATWHGITATPEGCAQKIDLTANSLAGTLPALDLNTLDTLILKENALAGGIPELKTPFLSHLDLSRNGLTGSFPAALSKMYGLASLDLSDNQLLGPIPPDLGDLEELQKLRLDSNQIIGELPVELTKLLKLQPGQVDFSNNDIDSLKQKIIWFCPFGDSILAQNPSYNRFLNICNVLCDGLDWDSLASGSGWLPDTLAALGCGDTTCLLSSADAGFVVVRGARVAFTRERCYTELDPGEPPVFIEEVRFFDCAGHLIETATCDQEAFCSLFSAISREEFDSLDYDVRWGCGQAIDTTVGTSAPPPFFFEKKGMPVRPLTCSPNPAGFWTVCTAGEGGLHPGQLLLTDATGRPQQANWRATGGRLELETGGLPGGLYFLFYQNPDGFFVGKLAVE